MGITLTVTAGPAKGQSFTFEKPDRFLFGRARDARVSLPHDPFVSRYHFLIEVAPPHGKITDLGSKNGIFVNGVRYGGRKPPKEGVAVAPQGVIAVPLADGMEIVVGDTRFVVRIDPARPDQMGVDSDSPAAQGQSAFEEDDGSEGLTLSSPRFAPPSQMRKRAEHAPEAPVLSKAPAGSGAGKTGASGGPAFNFGTPSLCVPPPPPPPAATPAKLDSANQLTEAMGVDQIAEIRRASARNRKKRETTSLQIEGYHIEGKLGEGGMGMVYRGVEQSSGRSVAIKMLLPERQVTFDQFRSFYREIEVTRQLKHRNIVELIAHGKVKGAYYCVLEYVDGMDLRELMDLRGGKVALDEAIPIMLGVLDGLSYAHRAELTLRAEGRSKVYHGVVHRDLKPENIFLTKDDRGGQAWVAKVADFGISKSFESAGMTDMTMGDGVCGTPVYWPREQLTHYRYLDPATDVFSVASVFYEMLTGKWARPGLLELYQERHEQQRSPDLADFMRLIAANRVLSLGTTMPSLPQPVSAVFDRALQEMEVPNDEEQMRRALKALRYPDAGAFAEALSSALRFSGFDVQRRAY